MVLSHTPKVTLEAPKVTLEAPKGTGRLWYMPSENTNSVSIFVLAIVQYSFTQKVLTGVHIQISEQLLPKA